MLLESFRPGVLDRLGVGYERMREVNPGIVYCAISGYGQSGPKREASGHDMNYLGLVGLLGLTGRARRPAGSGRRADRGPRRRRADGGVRDPCRAARARWAPARDLPPRRRRRDREPRVAPGEGSGGRTSRWPTARSRGWRWWPRHFADGNTPHRGELLLAGSVICYRPYECADGWVTLGALEPKFWQAWCRGVGARGPDRAPVRSRRAPMRTRRWWRSSSRAPARSGSSSRASTTAAWSRCWSSTRRSTPSWCAPARWSSRSISPVSRVVCASSACPSSCSVPLAPRPPARPRAGRAHRGSPRRGRLLRRGDRCVCWCRAPPPGPPSPRGKRHVPGVGAPGSGRADRSGR